MINYRSAILKENQQSTTAPIKLFYTSMNNFPLHWHETLEFIIVLDGTIDIQVNDTKYHLVQNDILLINSRDLHSFEKMENKKNKIFILQVEPIFFSRNSLNAETMISPLRIFNKKKHFQKSEDNHDLLHNYFKRIMHEYDNYNDSSTIAVSSSLLEIYLILIRSDDCDAEENMPIPNIDRLRNVISYVNKNFMNKITLSDAAESVCLSDFHFSREFKKYSGLTFFDYLKSFRINYAQYLLLSSDQSITDIAFQCGFNNLKTFNRQFHSITGASPSHYRKNFS